MAQQVTRLLDPLPIATKYEVARIDRQIVHRTCKLRELEKVAPRRRTRGAVHRQHRGGKAKKK